MSSNEDIALRWWYEIGRTDQSKDEFLEDRHAWEKLECAIFRDNGDHLDHDDTKSLIRRLDKGGMLGHDTLNEAIEVKQIRDTKKKEWGLTRGVEGFAAIIDTMSASTTKTMPQSHVEYINSGVWKRRAADYLNDHATHGGKWVCEVCGTGHDVVWVGRTIQVHHNTYSRLDGSEPDAHLMACCDELCHQTADILRRIKSGNVDASALNDMMRPLFEANKRS